MFVIFILVFSLTQLPVLFEQILNNYVHLLMVKAYIAPITVEEKEQYLQYAWTASCYVLPALGCQNGDARSSELILERLDEHYIHLSVPLYVITDTLQLEALALRSAKQANDDFVSITGEGYLEARIFLLTDSLGLGTISVRAQHDHPPSVNLEIWLDGQRIGDLAFARGDHTWETLSVRVNMSLGVHLLRIWYVNDYFDQGLGLDRNAYIKHIVIAP